jgi:NTP pyrophosphatase (non-canonical NTP hydrolase)
MSGANSEDQLLNLCHANREFRKIAALKGWQAYHNPKNLAAAIAVEAGELLAEFQWLTPDESACLNADQKSRVSDEVADVIMYLSELCVQLDIDIATAVETKIQKNKQRFTAD